jgi:hypothetical protein
MRLRSVLAVAALVSASLVARADTYTVFNLNSSFNHSGSETVSGTLTLDDTTDLFSSADLVASGFGFPPDTLSTITSQGPTGHPPVEEVTVYDGGLTALDLYLPVATLAGYDGGPICSFDTSGCHFDDTDYQVFLFGNFALAGSLTPETNIAPAPEPSSLLLIGTGLLGMAGVMRRKIQSRSLI